MSYKYVPGTWAKFILGLQGALPHCLTSKHSGVGGAVHSCVVLFLCVCMCVSVCVLVAQSCLTLCNPMDLAHQAPLSMEFFRQEYWTGLPFTSPGDFPDPQMEPRSPALQMAILPSEPPEKSQFSIYSKFLPSSLPTAPSQPWRLSEDVNHHHSSWEITAVVSKRPLLLPLFFPSREKRWLLPRCMGVKRASSFCLLPQSTQQRTEH